MLTAQKQRLEADLVRARERLEGTQRDLTGPLARFNRLVPVAVSRVIDAILANPPSPQALDLTLNVVSEAAIVLERSVVSRPFPDVVSDARAGRIPMSELERALVSCPSLRGAKQDRTLWLASDGDVVGHQLLRFAEGELDLVVVDAQTPDHCVHFPVERLSHLRLLAEAVAVEAAATRWAGVPFDTLVKYPANRVLVRGENLRNLVWTDHANRPFFAVFTADDALDAFLAQSPDLGEPVERRWMSGHALFPVLSKLELGGIIVNPAGPGGSRVFNRGTLGALA